MAKMWGDEFAIWMETQDGYRVVRNADGYYYYATLGANGDYVPTSSKVGIDAPPPPVSYKLERSASFMNTIEQLRQAAKAKYQAAAQWFAQKQAAANGQPVVLRLGVIFVEFADVKHYKSPPSGTRPDGYRKSDFDSMLFSTNYWIGPPGNDKHPEGEEIFGSMRDYYYQMSRGKLILIGSFINPVESNGVPRWLLLRGNKNYYYTPNDELYSEPKQMAVDSVRLNPSVWTIDPTQFEQIIIIFAGHQPEANFMTFAWGSWIACPERWGTRLWVPIDIAFGHPGVFAHEFGHNLGYSDTYADQYGNTNIYTLSDLMGGWYV